tara:strand:+ start:7015 stop:8055 length:1041 start_codon:yes stop_codon:yes gene_type:complete
LGGVSDFISLTKPRVVVLLQITAMCSVLVHDSIGMGLGFDTISTMGIVFVGGYLTAGGANAINMWYDRDIDPKMSRTANRAIPKGKVSPESALYFGLVISFLGTSWFYFLSNAVAAFWSAFSILFYVIIYSMWLKRSTPQNIVIGGVAGSTPPVIAWAASEESLIFSLDSVGSLILSVFDIGSLVPWFMFILIFLWTPPHFWALALYRSDEYSNVGVPMMPNVKGPERTIIEMKAYCILLVLLSFTAPESFGEMEPMDLDYLLLGSSTVGLSLWYSSTVWRIDVKEKPDESGRIASAASSFFVSLLYLTLMFIVLVTASLGFTGSILGFGIAFLSIARTEMGSHSK